MATSAKLAVKVQSAHKSYGSKPVLKNLSMEVPKGCIYGLLGASGCGKTTLLSCIVGQRILNSGSVEVLGAKPGTPESGVPGPQVGYMPQDIALVGEFTVKDAIFYFGRVFDMSESRIKERFIKLSQLLELPPENRLIKSCSGGQQRRVSFAASMVHMPKLLILDEPTVGVDPILRERIWDYLVEITEKSNTAIIITTHYIEETRRANVIGLMRDGVLLAEESPSRLLQTFQVEYLEDVFLILGRRQNEGRLDQLRSGTPLELDHQPIINHNESLQSINTTQGSQDVLTNNNKLKTSVGGFSLNWRRSKALLDKNWKQFHRNHSGMFFTFMFPIMQTFAFFLAIGGDPKNIPMGIVNDEALTSRCGNFSFNESAEPYGYSNCHLHDMSCRFLTYLDDPMMKKVVYGSREEALEGIHHGEIVGALYMAGNFSESLEDRVNLGKDAKAEVLKFSEVHVWMDMSNRQVGGTLKHKLFKLYVDFQKSVFSDCNFDSKLGEIFQLETFFGTVEGSYIDHMVPGLVLTIVFFMMSLITSQIIITDRIEGVWDRSTIAGVSSLEITLTHFLLQTGIVIVYTLETLLIAFVIFGTKNIGNIWTLGLITFLQGLVGMSYGFWISVISYNISMANILSTGSFYIMILLCGLLWPLEGMPLFLQWIAKCLPFTIAMESFRNVMKKGWSLWDLQVVNGVGIEVLWIVLLGGICIFMIKNKQ